MRPYLFYGAVDKWRPFPHSHENHQVSYDNYIKEKNSLSRVLSISSFGALDALCFEHLLRWLDLIAKNYTS
jgi:hypothetical protein